MKNKGKTGAISTPKSKEVKNPSTVNFVMSQDEQFKLIDSLPPVKKVYDGIEEGTLTFVIGPPKVGKTTYCENMALCIALGFDEFLGKPIEAENRKVLVISLEESSRLYARRRQIQASKFLDNNELYELFCENFLTINDNLPSFFTSDDDWSLLKKAIIQSGAKIVFIDSLTRLYCGGIEESSKAKQVTMQLRELVKELHITLFVIHHIPKHTIDKPLGVFSMAGSRVLAAEVDSIYGVTKTSGGVSYIKEIENRYKRKDDECMVFEIDDNQWINVTDSLDEDEIIEGTKKDKRKSAVNTKPIYNYFKEKVCCTTKQLKEKFVDDGTMSGPTLNTQLKKLEEAGSIKRTGHGEYELIVEVK